MTGRHGLNNKTYQQRDAREEGFGVFAFSSRLFPQHEELESSLSLKEAQENAAWGIIKHSDKKPIRIRNEKESWIYEMLGGILVAGFWV